LLRDYRRIGGVEEAVEDLRGSRVRDRHGIAGEEPGVIRSLRGELLFEFDPGSLSGVQIGKVHTGCRVGREWHGGR